MLGAATLDGEQIVQMNIAVGLQDFRPGASGKSIAMAPQRNSARLIACRESYSGVAALGVDEAGCCVNHGCDLTIGKITTQGFTLPEGMFRSVSYGRMSATDWTQLEEPHERLKWARKHAHFATASAAAESLGMKAITYSAYEREPGSSKNIALDHQMAIKAGRKYRVSWTWLLVGEGTPFDKPSNEFQQRAIQAMAAVPEEKQAALAAAIEAMVSSAA